MKLDDLLATALAVNEDAAKVGISQQARDIMVGQFLAIMLTSVHVEGLPKKASSTLGNTTPTTDPQP
jgi:hypothetical protein